MENQKKSSEVYESQEFRLVDDYPLAKEGIEIDMQSEVGSPKEAKKYFGIDAPIVAGIRIKTPDVTVDNEPIFKDYFILNLQQGAVWPKLLVIGGDEPLMLAPGEEYIAGARGVGDATDGEKFILSLNQAGSKLEARGLDDKASAYLGGYVPDSPLTRPYSLYSSITVSLVEEARTRFEYREGDAENPYGYLGDHHIIGRHTKSVRGGLYGSSGRDITLVDDQESKIEDLSKDVLEMARWLQDNGSCSEVTVLNYIKGVVRSALTYDFEKVQFLNDQFKNNDIVLLSEYVDAGTGICQQQALLVCVLMEKAVESGFLKGEVRVERNQDLNLGEAHAWAIYKPADLSGDVVVDATQDYIGTREFAQESGRWSYYMREAA